LPSSSQQRLSQPEFIALIAMLFAMVAFSIDAMLPALPEIAAEISPDAPNRAQLILTSFVFGMGLGTLLTGPLSDRFGRKPVILCGAALYVIGAAMAWQASTLTEMLAARVLQGLGVAGPRIVALAIIRDLYEGRRMAQIMSYAMMIFALVPAIAPFMGALIIDAFGWRMIFAAFILFCLIASTWLALRQPETLPLIAVIAGTASILNAKLVVALGMRKMIQIGLGGLAILSAIVALTGLMSSIPFALFMLWATAIFFMVGLVIGNLNALAMEPLGHIAGLAASVIGSVSTMLGAGIAIPIGLAFDGTPVPLAIGLSALTLTGYLLIRLGAR